MLSKTDLKAEFRKWLTSKRLEAVGPRATELFKELCDFLEPSLVNPDSKKTTYYRYRLRYDLVMVDELGDLLSKSKAS